MIAPLADEIPDDFKDFLDPQGLLSDILNDTLNNAVNSAAESGIEALVKEITAVIEKKGIAVIKDE